MPSQPDHDCPGGCGAQIPYAQLACGPDWGRLPKPLRDDVNTAYRRRRANPMPHLRAVAVASRWYRDNPRG
jgi:hypothetical protein